ncbi:ABC transporter ATP-binding protein/permease [Streptomyces litchfieldiae]|uniref:ABC transporter ATP-binding protein n=1 Tax=Streptomyces litchfieldiae TaxID=3075543 RepID=A0ABU2MPP6_9ACTN|nr:ABC transporter ATP-binding protein [Streptomyces sp. DSM 44938]MDT0343597.1 ABC transporter ATP-binding protein [Streptomyces sp. DSM 44938]
MIHGRLLRLAGAVALPVLLCAAVSASLSVAALLQAYATARALTHLFAGDARAAAGALVWASSFTVLRSALVWLAEVTRARCGITIRVRLRDRLVAKLGELGPSYAAGARAGQIQATLVAGVEGLDAYYARYLPQLLVTLVVPACVVGWLFTVWAPAAWVLGCAVATAVIVPRFWDATLLRRGRSRWAGFTRLGADYLEAVQAVPTLRIHGVGGHVDERLAGRARRLYRSTMAQLRASLVENGVSALAIHGGTAATVVVVAAAATRGTVGPADAFVFLVCARECFRPVNDLASAWHAGYLGLTAADGMEELLTAPVRVRDTGHAGAPEGPPEVRFESVTYAYPVTGTDQRRTPRKPRALESVSLVCPPGSLVGIVGPSGSGKSSLVHLLQRHDDPGGGRVLLAGRPLPDYRLDALRATVAVVHQDPYLFHASVADNIRLARPNADDEEVAHAARLAQADSFIRALPQGYDTVIGERGSSLSGGQAQRLALARAFLTRAPVLVLDEATSHLDVPTERAVGRALATELAGRTRLVVAHRLSAVRDADLIAVVVNGRVRETGTHEELMRRRDGTYRMLAQRQGPAERDREVPA